MQLEVVVFTLFIQMAIQLALYFSTVKIVHALIKYPVRFISWGHWILGLKRQEFADGMVAILMILYNIGISMVVLYFTNSSALAGITNLGASVGVGIFMGMHFRKDGTYYIETPERHIFKSFANKIGKSCKKWRLNAQKRH